MLLPQKNSGHLVIQLLLLREVDRVVSRAGLFLVEEAELLVEAGG